MSNSNLVFVCCVGFIALIVLLTRKKDNINSVTTTMQEIILSDRWNNRPLSSKGYQPEHSSVGTVRPIKKEKV